MKGTTLYRLHTAEEIVILIGTLLAHGCPPPAIVVACKSKRCRSIGSRNRVTSGRGKQMRDAIAQPGSSSIALSLDDFSAKDSTALQIPSGKAIAQFAEPSFSLTCRALF
jgi:hypothetical protein